jgi:hypothetical protein
VTTARERAALALAGAAYGAAIVEAADEVRRELLAWVEDNGLTKAGWDVVGDGGEVFGSVRWNPGRVSARVVDDAALLDWVSERYPDEVHHVPTIRPAFLKKILDDVVAGTVPEPPGVKVAEGDPFLTVTPTPVAKALAREMADGQGRPTLPGLPAGKGE